MIWNTFTKITIGASLTLLYHRFRSKDLNRFHTKRRKIKNIVASISVSCYEAGYISYVLGDNR